MKADLKVTGVFPKTSEEVLETHKLMKEKVKGLGIQEPKILISLDSGIAYVFEMKEKVLPEGNITA